MTANLFDERSQLIAMKKRCVCGCAEKCIASHDEGLNRNLADEKHRLFRPERIDPRRGPQSIRCPDRDRRDIWTCRAKLVILALGTIAIARLSSSAIKAGILDSQRILITLREIRMKERRIFPEETKFVRLSTITHVLSVTNNDFNILFYKFYTN